MMFRHCDKVTFDVYYWRVIVSICNVSAYIAWVQLTGQTKEMASFEKRRLHIQGFVT